MSNPFLGQIAIFGFNFAPRGWALCNGQILAISQNTALFSLLGTTYGGNGTTTFALPNLQSRVPMHMGQGPGLSNVVEGETIGNENVALLINNLPSHSHVMSLGTTAASMNVKNGAGNVQSPVGNIPAIEAAGVTATYSTLPPDAAMGTAAISLSGTPTAALTGSNIPFDIHQPSLVLNFCIALAGIFPSRN